MWEGDVISLGCLILFGSGNNLKFFLVDEVN